MAKKSLLIVSPYSKLQATQCVGVFSIVCIRNNLLFTKYYNRQCPRVHFRVLEIVSQILSIDTYVPY